MAVQVDGERTAGGDELRARRIVGVGVYGVRVVCIVRIGQVLVVGLVAQLIFSKRRKDAFINL